MILLCVSLFFVTVLINQPDQLFKGTGRAAVLRVNVKVVLGFTYPA